ncbi:MAG: thioredoxin family protein [Pirellulales bacterium]
MRFLITMALTISLLGCNRPSTTEVNQPVAAADPVGDKIVEPEVDTTVKEAKQFISAFKETAGVGLYGVASDLEQKLTDSGSAADRLARELLGVKAEIVTNGEILELLDALAAQKKTTLAARVLLQIARARYSARTYVARGFDQTNVVVGQLIVEGGKQDPEMVLAQMPILEEGYFAGEVGDLRQPLCFRAHGYQSLDVPLLGKEADVLYLGQLTLKLLPEDQRVSLKGKVALDAASDAAAATVKVSVSMPPINTPHKGFAGRRRWPEGISVPVSKTGEFTIDGLNPSDYNLTVSADGHVDLSKSVKLTGGQPSDAGTVRLYSSDLGFYIGTPAPHTDETAWETDYKTALRRAQSEQRPMLVMMTATWCGPCKLLEEKTLNDAWIRYFLSRFILLKAYEDQEVEKLYGLQGYPTLAFADSSGKLAHKCVGYMPTSSFAAECCKAFPPLSIALPPEMAKLAERGIINLK